jgi:hypothetical protein
MYPVFISNNGLDYSQASSNIFLRYHAAFTISAVSLRMIQIDPHGKVDITAYGQGLPVRGSGVDFFCVFAPTEEFKFLEVPVRATFPSDDGTEVLCPDSPTSFPSLDGSI